MGCGSLNSTRVAKFSEHREHILHVCSLNPFQMQFRLWQATGLPMPQSVRIWKEKCETCKNGSWPGKNPAKEVVSTLRLSYGKSKGRCLIRVLQLGSGIFPVNFCTEWLLWNDQMHFDCVGSHKCGPRSLSAAFYMQILEQSGSCDVSKCILTAQARAKSVSRSWPAEFYL